MCKPPAANFENFKQIHKTYLTEVNNRDVYLTGDFNINLLQYNTENNTNHFVNTLLQNNLLPLINSPTRITGSSETLIDNIFTNKFNNVKIHSGIIKTDISDHFPIFILLNDSNTEIEGEKHTTIFKREFNNTSIIEFRNLLLQVDWQLLEECKDADSAYDLFLRFFQDQYQKAFAKIEKKIKNKTLQHLWMTKELLKASKKKQRLYTKYLKKKTYENEKNYKDFYRSSLYIYK